MDKLDNGKLENTLVILSKLGDAVKMKLLNEMSIINWLKKFMLFRPLILLI